MDYSKNVFPKFSYRVEDIVPLVEYLLRMHKDLGWVHSIVYTGFGAYLGRLITWAVAAEQKFKVIREPVANLSLTKTTWVF